jgi:phosphate starvation-inducible protein PhoH and related proteins
MPQKRKKQRQFFYEREQPTVQTQTTNPQKFDIEPRNLSQARLLRALEDDSNHIVFSLGSAGVGKTYITAKFAAKQLLEKKVKKIVITRPTVEAGEKIGFLPGTLEEKMEPWLLPIYDAFMEDGGFTKEDIKSMITKGTIEIAPFNFLRGRSLKNCLIIADEMQNSEQNQIKMLLTRLGDGSKIVVTGDLSQTDRRTRVKSGLEDFLWRLEQNSIDGIELVKFNDSDIVRHPIIGEILKLYGEE